jgi:hypothetical protein
LQVSFLRYWINEDYAKNYFKHGIKSIKFAAEKFKIRQQLESEKHEEKIPEPTPNSAKKQAGAKHYNLFFGKATKIEKHNKAQEDFQSKSKLDLKNEIKNFKKKLVECNMNYKHSTPYFWMQNSSKFPYLFKLAQILLNIQSSAAGIERFFSICGVVCSERRGAMKNDLIRNRCLLKANFEILNELRLESEDN